MMDAQALHDLHRALARLSSLIAGGVGVTAGTQADKSALAQQAKAVLDASRAAMRQLEAQVRPDQRCYPVLSVSFEDFELMLQRSEDSGAFEAEARRCLADAKTMTAEEWQLFADSMASELYQRDNGDVWDAAMVAALEDVRQTRKVAARLCQMVTASSSVTPQIDTSGAQPTNNVNRNDDVCQN